MIYWDVRQFIGDHFIDDFFSGRQARQRLIPTPEPEALNLKA
jgi:hypothetical protein